MSQGQGEIRLRRGVWGYGLAVSETHDVMVIRVVHEELSQQGSGGLQSTGFALRRGRPIGLGRAGHNALSFFVR